MTYILKHVKSVTLLSVGVLFNFFIGLAILFIMTASCKQSKELLVDDDSKTSIIRPNIILIMADDMGFSDVGCYGSEIQTPNIDGLARDGRKFSQFYNAGRCCPSRASLLTGKYSHNVDMGWMTGVDMKRPGYKGDLKRGIPTLASKLKGNGYNTYMTGKWHLALSEDVVNGISENTPVDRGFMEFYGTLEGAKDYYDPKFLYRNKNKVKAEGDYFYTRAITDTARSFIKYNKHNPFFLYLAFYAPHFPLQAPNEIIEKYKGKYLDGWSSLKKKRFDEQKKMGLFSSNTVLNQDTILPEWNTLNTDQKSEMDYRMAIYAAQVEELDRSIGKVIQQLKKDGIYDDTLIIFLSDNGGLGVTDLGMGETSDLNKTNTPYTSYGKVWGNVSNTPYRKYKSYAHEGGIISPLIVSWPNKIKARQDFITQPLHIIDLFPTINSICGIENLDTQGMDFSQWLFEPNKANIERMLFWEHEGKRAVRLGDWKLVSEGLNEPWQLYNLQSDPTEIRNIAREFPKLKDELVTTWNRWAMNNNVLPLDGSTWEERIRNFKN